MEEDYKVIVRYIDSCTTYSQTKVCERMYDFFNLKYPRNKTARTYLFKTLHIKQALLIRDKALTGV